MNLYHLRYFVTLAHLEHYTKAAELLSITQSAHGPWEISANLRIVLLQQKRQDMRGSACVQRHMWMH